MKMVYEFSPEGLELTLRDAIESRHPEYKLTDSTTVVVERIDRNGEFFTRLTWHRDYVSF